ncbi:hypothetical protein EV182_001190 [Spiromyces aspiralis]|uniref:Uncharacterized protein n=1 Tax=Spiromyces aspiralis TaxID=68401 RepID=A0ACC1HJH1_9FUNG|nr:hypothetical protein EV182_001190 [Spiromyces aspiralis]
MPPMAPPEALSIVDHLEKCVLRDEQGAKYPVIDVRPSDLYKQSHLKNSLSLPWDEDPYNRLFELPPKNTTPIYVVGANTAMLDEPVRLLTSRGWQIVHTIIWAADTPSESLRPFIENGHHIEGGCRYTMVCQPLRFLSSHIEAIEAALCERAGGEAVKTWRALDIGCGSGRDMAFLALRGIAASLARGWDVTGIDSVPGCVSRCLQFAARLGISDRMRAVRGRFIDTDPSGNDGAPALPGEVYMHLRTDHGTHPFTTKSKYDLVLLVRFLNRESFDLIDHHIAPGGFLLISTFVEGPGLPEYSRPPPGSCNRLQLGELRRFWHDRKGYSVVADIVELLDDNRPINSFLAQKPCI